MPGKPVIARDPDDPSKRYQLVNNAWVPLENPAESVPSIDPNQFADARASLEDISNLKGRADWKNTGFVGGISSKIPGTPGFDLAADILPVQARGMIGKMIQLKQASPTGATGFGNLSEAEGETIRSTMGNLNNGQSTPQFSKNLNRAEELIGRAYPGLTQRNPVDLSAGQSRTQIPKGAYYKDKDGNIRRNDNLDNGNPIVLPKGGNVAQNIKGQMGNKNLKSKYGLE